MTTMDRKELMKKLEQMKKELANKQKKLEKAKRAAVVKAHVKQKIRELNGEAREKRTPSTTSYDHPTNSRPAHSNYELDSRTESDVAESTTGNHISPDTVSDFDDSLAITPTFRSGGSTLTSQMPKTAYAMDTISKNVPAGSLNVDDSLAITPSFRSEMTLNTCLKGVDSFQGDSLQFPYPDSVDQSVPLNYRIEANPFETAIFKKPLTKAADRNPPKASEEDCEELTVTVSPDENKASTQEALRSSTHNELYLDRDVCHMSPVMNDYKSRKESARKQPEDSSNKLQTEDDSDRHQSHKDKPVAVNCTDLGVTESFLETGSQKINLLQQSQQDISKASGTSLLKLQDIGNDEHAEDKQSSSPTAEKPVQEKDGHDDYLDYTELDVIPYSQFELTEDFLSESWSSQNSTGCPGRRKSMSALIQRKSPRLSSFTFSDSDLSTVAHSHSNVFRMSRKKKKTKNALLLSSAFQFLIDEAKRNPSFTEFSLPAYMADLATASSPSQTSFEDQSIENKEGQAKMDSTKSVEISSLCASAVSTEQNVRACCTLTDSEVLVIPETEIDPDFQYSSIQDTDEDVCQTIREEDSRRTSGAIHVSEKSELPDCHSVTRGGVENVQKQKQIVDDHHTETATTPKATKSAKRKSNRQSLRLRGKTVKSKGEGADISSQQTSTDSEQFSAERKLQTTNSTTKDSASEKQERACDSTKKDFAKENQAQSVHSANEVTVASEVKENASPDIAKTKPFDVLLQKTPIKNSSSSNFDECSDSPILFGTQAEKAPDSVPKHDRSAYALDAEEHGIKPVFTPSKNKRHACIDDDQGTDQEVDGSTWIKYAGCAESGCKDPVIQTLAGVSKSDGEEVVFILSVQTSALTLWTMDDQQDWSAEFSWYLPQNNQAEGACRMQTSDGDLAILVWGIDAIAVSGFLTVFVYNWDTQRTQMFSLPLPSPVTPLRMFCHGLASSPSTVVVFASDRAFTRGKKYIVDRDRCCVSLEVVMETADSQLMDLQLVEGLEDAVVGLGLDQRLFVWNVAMGALLLVLPLPESVPALSRLFSCLSIKGFLLMHTLEKSVEEKLCLLAMNPSVFTGKVLQRFSSDSCRLSAGCQATVYKGALLVNHENSLQIWNSSSGKLVVSLQNMPSRISASQVFNTKDSCWLIAGQSNGCLHMYLLNEPLRSAFVT